MNTEINILWNREKFRFASFRQVAEGLIEYRLTRDMGATVKIEILPIETARERFRFLRKLGYSPVNRYA